jgi:hypothetical protein
MAPHLGETRRPVRKHATAQTWVPPWDTPANAQFHKVDRRNTEDVFSSTLLAQSTASADKSARIGAPLFGLEPDAWERFERAVDIVVKSPPQHRTEQRRALQNQPNATLLRPPSRALESGSVIYFW